MSGPLDSRGCLTEAGIAAFREAPPGAAPQEVAAHVASCARCQNRLLETGTPQSQRGKARAAKRVAPSLARTLLLAVLALLALLVALATLSRLAGR